MTNLAKLEDSKRRRFSVVWPKLHVWQLSLLVAFVALAIRNIQDQRITEPFLIALAASGFVGYGAIGCWGWMASKRLEDRLGPRARLILYLGAMAALFLLATGIYLYLEYRYRNG